MIVSITLTTDGVTTPYLPIMPDLEAAQAALLVAKEAWGAFGHPTSLSARRLMVCQRERTLVYRITERTGFPQEEKE